MYRYYFLRRKYDVDRIRDAVKRLEGEHDFRNFCRIDTNNVCDFTRAIFRGDVVEVKKGFHHCHQIMLSADPEHDVLAVEIIGRAFLWHQVSFPANSHSVDSVHHERVVYGRFRQGVA